MNFNRYIKDFAKKCLSLFYKIKYFCLKHFEREINLTNLDAQKIIDDNCDYSQENFSIQTENIIKEKFDLMVVIPAYNCEKTIKKCIDSVLCQTTTYTYQIVVVDDGSTDNTADILKNYDGNEKVKVIFQENQGLSGARNSALKLITGRYIFFLDSDDYLPTKNAIQKILDTGYKNDADIVEGAAYSFYYENGSVKKNRNMLHSYEGNVKSLSDMMGYPWGKIYKSELFRNVKFPNHLWFEDTIISMILYPKAKKKIITNDLVYAYQVNANGITHSSAGQRKLIDTYFITALCVKEEKNLSLINQETQKLFLNQLAMNYFRLKSLSHCINKAVIVLSIQLYRKNFSHVASDILNYKERSLVKALNTQKTKDIRALLECWYYL